MTKEIFDDYYDDEGNLHIDARKPKKKITEVKNFRFTLSDKDELFSENHKKIIIHHCNLVDDSYEK